GAAGAAGLAGWARAAAGASVAPSAGADALYERALILDCNSGAADADHLPLPRAALETVRGSGIDVIKFSLGGINSDFAATVGVIALVQRLIEVHPDYFMQVRVVSDMARAQRERKLGIIL